MSKGLPNRRDMEDGFLFANSLESINLVDTRRWQVWLEALIDELASNDMLDLEAFKERRQKIYAKELEEQENYLLCRINREPDKYSMTDLPYIDCHNLLETCKARCCTFSHVLSKQDLKEGDIEWDLMGPYIIKYDESKYCIYNCKESRVCNIFEKRPASCRSYDCRSDKRVWKNFENKIMAPYPRSPVHLEDQISARDIVESTSEEDQQTLSSSTVLPHDELTQLMEKDKDHPAMLDTNKDTTQ